MKEFKGTAKTNHEVLVAFLWEVGDWVPTFELVKLSQMLIGPLQLLVELFNFLKPLSFLGEEFVPLYRKQIANSDQYTDESGQYR